MTEISRVDMHCHSTASQLSRLGVQRALAIADRDDVFVSEELTASFRGEPQAVHVLCYGITPDDHDWLQARAGDVEEVAAYLRDQRITCALAHPFYAVAAPLTARHHRRLAELFDVWEVRNGTRADELNRPAAVYVDTQGGTGISGTDDHAGVDIGRTWSQTPRVATPEAYLAEIRARRVSARGEQESAPVVLRMVERIMAEGDARGGAIAADLEPATHGPCCGRGWPLSASRT